MTHQKSYPSILPIERPNGFPVEELGRLVKVEGRGPEVSRPPLYLHKWWARRFGSIFRSILLGILMDGELNVWESHYQAHNFADQIILDPFMGSGTTLFEAARLGAKVIGGDINPVAWWTTRTALSQPPSWKSLAETFKIINQEAQALFSRYYETTCPTCLQEKAITRHVRWAYTLHCKQCQEQTTLFKSYVLGKHKGGVWLLCPTCGFIFWTKQFGKSKTECQCPECQTRFKPKKGNTARGKFTCRHCHQKNEVRKSMAQLDNPVDHARMIAIFYDCARCGWGIKRPTDDDRRNDQQAREAFLSMQSELAIPKQKIRVKDRIDPRPINYGYKRWMQLFTPRQLLVLGWLAARVRDLPLDVKEPFVNIVSQLANYTNAFCVPRPNRPGAVSWIFRMHAFVPPTDFLENNPLAGRRMSGTFQNLFWRSTKAAYQFRNQPAERKIKSANINQSVAVPIAGERVLVTLVDSWESLVHTPNAALLLHQSSDHLPLPDKSISHIVTDPPFHDNLAYGELSEFNYVWLREMLANDFPQFPAGELPVADLQLDKELIVSKRIGKDNAFYAEGMAAIFAECHRVLADSGLFTFTYHHKSREAWETLLYALLKAKFRVVGLHPVRSESDRSLHIMTGDTIEHDLIIVCRKASKSREILWDRLVKQMRHHAEGLLNKLDDTYRQSRANVATLVYGQCLRLFSESYPKIYKADSREKVSISEGIYAAEQIAQLITESANQPQAWQPRLLEGGQKYETSPSKD